MKRSLSLLLALTLLCALLPLCINQTHFFQLGKVHDINAIGTMNRYTTASCDKSYNFISRHRAAAFGKMHCHIIKSFYNDTTLGFLWNCLILILGRHIVQYILIGKLDWVVFPVLLQHLIHDLAFFQSAVS